MDLSGYKVIYQNNEKLFAKIYDFLYRADLVNPEITFMYSGTKTLTYSRDGGFGEGKLPGKEKWKKLVQSGNLYGFLLVAGTDKEDIRRMSVAYVADGEPAIFVNFLAEDGCLTGREKRLLISLRGFQ